MRPGDRLVLNGENLLRRVILPEEGGEAGGILAAGRLGDADDLLFGVDDQLVIVFRQGLDGTLSAADLAEGYDFSLFVPLEEGLDLENRSDHGGEVGETAAAAKVHQVVHREDIEHPFHMVVELGNRLGGAASESAQPVGIERDNALAERGAAGVDHFHNPVGIGLHHHSGSNFGRVAGPADARGHTDENDVLPLSKRGLKEVSILLRRNLGSGNLHALLDLGVIILGVEVGVLYRIVFLPVDIIGKRDDFQRIVQHILPRQIAGRIGHDNKRHCSALLYMVLETA